MIQILPAVLATNPQDYIKDIKKLNSSNAFQQGWVHIDFMDNKFVPNQSIEPSITTQIKTNLKKEAHLMVENPTEWVEKIADAGFERAIIHFEANDIEKAIDLAKQKGLEVGIALKNETSLEKLTPFIDKIDMVLIMSVNPGFQGQPFLEEAFERIKSIKNKGWKVKVAVDGAVRDTNAKKLVEAGVDQLDIGSFLLKGDNIDENLEKIWETLQS